MSNAFEQTVSALQKWCAARGIETQERLLPANKAGEFNGVSVVMNSAYDAEERAYYLVHAIGSIVRRSLDAEAIQRMFDELRDAKESRKAEPNRLEHAITRYRKFETESSEFAVRILADCGFANIVRTYANFMRADLEALTEFHRTGRRTPVWQEFFRKWNEEVAAGKRQIEPFEPRPIPVFQPVKTEKQEILQRQG